MNSRATMTTPMNKGTANIFFKTRMCARFRIGACRNGENCNFAHGIEDLRQPPSNWQELVGSTTNEERERERERERPSSSVVVGNMNSWDEDQKIIQRMKLCRKFCCGEECPYGDRCNFVHEDLAKYRDDSSKLRESDVISISIGNGNGGADPLVVNMCSSSSQIEANRHGGPMPMPMPIPVTVSTPTSNQSLNSMNSKAVYWKTRLCMKFEITGQCPFGDKCHFAHGQAELHNALARVEGEAVNAVTFASKPQTISCNDPLAAKAIAPLTAVSSSLNEEVQRKKCLFKWNDPKKINRIYADWIDDLPVGQTAAKQIES